MNKSILFLCLILLACEDEPMDHSSKGQLSQITVNGKINSSFEYKNGLLTKENFFWSCESTPTEEYMYDYQNELVKKFTLITRSFYSNTASHCDPDLGLQYENTFEYDDKNRLVKVIRSSGFTEYFYNADNRVEKQVIHNNSGAITSEANFNYDHVGNLIEERNFIGDIVHYKFDNKPNPFFLMNQRPDWISPFNKSPNNVIKASGAITFEREFQYGPGGLPVKVTESSNGQVYTYVYE